MTQTNLRSNTCGELTLKNKGNEVKLAGWMHAKRIHGGIIFIDLRDRYGLTQLVFDSSHNKDTYKIAEKLNKEDVLSINGKVRPRAEGFTNKKLKTGEIEVLIDTINLISKAEPLPLDIEGDEINANEDTRLKYRYLDLRRDTMQKNLLIRHKVTKAARDYFDKLNFLEIETPMLARSTPEGARDYLVPSRVNKGTFYALPQSPQLYKQLLMISGCDRYFQIARCLRDEDLRADRQPEHTQIDLEISFVDADGVRKIVEGLFKHIFKEVLKIKLNDFPVFSYQEAMDRFGIDKPDIRFALELNNITETAKKTDFNIFKQAEYVGCLIVDKNLSRKEIDKLTETAKIYKAKGLAYVKSKDKKLDEGIAKFLDGSVQEELVKNLKLKNEQTLLFVADKKKTAQTVLGQLRNELRDKLELVKPDDFKFCWVNDFPLFSYNEDEKRWEPEHHMFSMPKTEFIDDFEKRPEEVLGDLWDLTLNGVELASGSIRVSNPKIQERIMNFIGMSKKEAHEKFGFLLDAYKYGGPVHGGMGIGLDRVVALMLGLSDIREVIAFPKNKAAFSPLDESPNVVDKKQLDELNISLKK